MPRPDPYALVAAALECPLDALDADSGLDREPAAWDSMAHLRVMLALEEVYGIVIDDETIERYARMAAILDLHAAARP
ncbi:MAG: hypothetical protein CMM50_05000 [Rhodospirillaceae bacterium]|nr:hypothetical protein [Rhodospirillaceae bacterium]